MNWNNDWWIISWFIITIWLLFIQLASTTTTWSNGFFEQDGSWVAWDPSWYTCANATQWTSCYNKILNNSTKLWNFWPYGQFYSPQVNKWISWDGSWLEEWGYQDECYVWPTGMMFDLTQFTWVSNCTSSQVFILDPLLKNIPIWRDTTYYIDANGLQPIELGTLKYPYKKIGLATMEILNFISHSNHNVTIYIMENNLIYMTNLRNFYIDFPNIQITTYSSTQNTPMRAIIQITDAKKSYFSNSTQFNIVANVTLRLTQALNYTGYTSVETDISSYSTAVLITNRCSLSISNIDVYRNITSDKNLDVPFIIAIYEQAHTVTMINMDFHISGRILRSSQPLNVYVQNVYMDFYGMMGGIYINADCNYPEASITGSIVITNVTAVNSQTRIAQFMSGILYYAGPANVTVQNTNVLIYGSLSNDKSQIDIEINSACMPSDGNIQTIRINDNLFSQTSNPDSDRFVEMYIDVISNYPRQIASRFYNNQITNIVQNVYPVFYWFFTGSSTVYLSNNTISNVSAQQGLITINTMNTATLLNSVFYNSSDFGHNLYYFSNVQNVTVQNINLQNITATGASTDFVFLFDIINNGTVSIDTVYMNNVNIGLQAGFYFNGLMSKISYTNMYFSNINVGNNNRMISAGEFNSIVINNVTFINSFDQYSSDSDNMMIVFDTILLDNAQNSSISNIYSSVSRIDFIRIENVVGSTSVPVFLNFVNVTYRDWNLRFHENLMVFSNMSKSRTAVHNFRSAYIHKYDFPIMGGYWIVLWSSNGAHKSS